MAWETQRTPFYYSPFTIHCSLFTAFPFPWSVELFRATFPAAWAASVATGDTTTISRILADDFVGIDPQGKSYDKAEMIRDTKNAPKYFRSNKLDDVKIRFFGDTAVAQGSETWERQNGQRGQFVWTDTWIRRKGVWQIVAAEDLIVLAPVPAPNKP